MNAPLASIRILQDLEQQRYPIRLAVTGSDGFPRIVSLWFKQEGESLYCVTHESAWILRQLELNNQVGFEISSNSPPYKGLRGVGYISLAPLEGDLLEQLIVRYLNNTTSSLAKWLLSRKDDEIVIRISPSSLSSWDYTRRMGEEINHG
ncbi:MAG: hypothetical protein ACJA0N_000375 [Pseudohongiellaceae bacterium]|jgi:hypothetical protein